jgi:hypothetical protein
VGCCDIITKPRREAPSTHTADADLGFSVTLRAKGLPGKSGIDRHYQNDVTQMLRNAATAAFVRSVSNFWSVTSYPSTSETTDEIFGSGDRDGRVMMIPWPRRC